MSGDIVINYHFKNYGKTPGIVREISHGVALSPHPPDPVYQVIAQAPTENMIAPSGRTDTQTCIKQISVNSIADALLLENGSTHIWFYGRFDYDDVITNEPQVHRFYFRYVRLEAHRFRLQAIDHRHYNEST